MRNFQMQGISFATIPFLTFFFQKDVAANIILAHRFVNWICGFATAFSNT